MKGGQTLGVLAGITVALTLTLAVSVLSVAAQSAGQALPTADMLACAPRLAALEASAGRLVGAPDNLRKRLFRQGDTVLINVGASSEVAVGTQFFTLRRVTITTPALRDRLLQADVTTGWLRAVEVHETATLAVIERTCADVYQDVLLAPFQWPPPVTAMASGAVSHDDPAMVLFGADGRALSAAASDVRHRPGHRPGPGARATSYRLSPRRHPGCPGHRVGRRRCGVHGGRVGDDSSTPRA